MKFKEWFLGFIMAASMQQRMSAAQWQARNGNYGRTRIPGKPGKAGAKLARKAAERRVTLRHAGGVV